MELGYSSLVGDVEPTMLVKTEVPSRIVTLVFRSGCVSGYVGRGVRCDNYIIGHNC